jgi:sulfate/thiosulfate transport system substrate-binding protein
MSPKPSLDRRHLLFGASALVTLAACGETRPGAGKGIELLNVSYDPTRELYEAYNPVFAKYWKDTKGQDVTIRQSHGGSGKQARSVIDGIEADVVTLALAADIDSIAEHGKQLSPDWEGKLPNHSAPYTSTIVFLVRKGNPKAIKSWEDLIRPGVAVITPNPKTSGGARWNYLAAYGWALKTYGNDQTKAKDYLKKLFANVPVLDTGARGSTVTFVERGVGDVLLAWENEAFLAVNKLGKGEFEIVVPPVSILAEPPVAVVDKIVARKGTAEVARAYLEYLYSKPAQDIIAQNYYRPIDAETAAKYASTFPTTELITIRDLGGWKKVQAEHFDEGGVFDAIGPAAKK